MDALPLGEEARADRAVAWSRHAGVAAGLRRKTFFHLLDIPERPGGKRFGARGDDRQQPRSTRKNDRGIRETVYPQWDDPLPGRMAGALRSSALAAFLGGQEKIRSQTSSFARTGHIRSRHEAVASAARRSTAQVHLQSCAHPIGPRALCAQDRDIETTLPRRTYWRGCDGPFSHVAFTTDSTALTVSGALRLPAPAHHDGARRSPP